MALAAIPAYIIKSNFIPVTGIPYKKEDRQRGMGSDIRIKNFIKDI